MSQRSKWMPTLATAKGWIRRQASNNEDGAVPRPWRFKREKILIRHGLFDRVS